MYRKNVWKENKDHQSILDFSEGYKEFLSYGKTERLACAYAVKKLEENGFVNAEKLTSVKPGDKVFFINKKKNVCAFVLGNKPLKEGLRILGAHIDSPRLDLKENPFYERDGLALGDTHYYGGIKKYQWTTTPLALHGVVCKKDGSVIEVHLGDDPKDPVFGITELLVHLSADQLQKPGAKVVEGEDLDITLGSIPLEGEEKEPVKKMLLKLLKEKYDVEEEDFISAEIEVVPAGKARDYGLDRSMVASYGQDDRACAYTSLMGLIDAKKVEHTACCILVDKEEIGSVGATGAQSNFFLHAVARLAELSGAAHPLYDAHLILEASKMLSSDVSAGVDPLYESASEKKNAAFLGQGLVFNKYTGSRGKGGSNDANPEYYAWVRKAMDDAGVCWQNAELGRVDLGGGGTIAYILGNMNMNVIDAGVPLLSMHSPMEIVSKGDIYAAYKGYIAFIEAE